MNTQMRVDIGCLLVGSYVDEAEVPANEATHWGEPVRAKPGGEFLEYWTEDESDEEPIIQTLLRVVQTETHGPSRAQMVESIVRLKALAIFRDVLGREPVSDAQRPAVCTAIEHLFASRDTLLPLLESLRSLRPNG